MKKFFHKKAPITSKQEIIPGIFLMEIESPEIASASAPGEFIHIAIEERPLRRPISIFRASDTAVSILFRVRGKGTNILGKKREKEELDILGPLGNGFPEPGKNPLFIAGGMGAAPLNYLASICSGGLFIYGFKSECESELTRHLDLKNHRLLTVCEEKTGDCVTDILHKHVKNKGNIFAAGPQAMFKSLTPVCKTVSQKTYVSWEERMGCGTGLCQACAVKTVDGYKNTCSEGPVFRFDEITEEAYHD